MASAQEHGTIEIRKKNTGSGRILPLKTQRTEILGYVAPASRTNPQEQDERLMFLEGGVAVDEKELIQVVFIADAADTIESEESKFHMDVTIVDKNSGAERSSALTFENMSETAFTVAGTVDIAHTAGQEVIVAEFLVPSGQQYILGKKDGRGKIYAYLGDDTA
jgi:hypothetical protein